MGEVIYLVIHEFDNGRTIEAFRTEAGALQMKDDIWSEYEEKYGREFENDDELYGHIESSVGIETVELK
jgi:hypothetical protein